MMGEAIKQHCGHLWISKYFGPLTESDVGGNRGKPSAE